MEKTVNIYIASTSFQCIQEAYDALSGYLARLNEHFKDEEDRAEIIRDIESRIAEKLIERKQNVITLADVAAVIADIGDSADLDDETPGDEKVHSATSIEKRLYRDTDNAYIGGVASGIAAYFNIDAIIVRLIFIVSIFFGGTGIFVYILLWIFIPEAKTAAQKLEMHGRKVTFDTIGSMVKERVEETKRNGALRSLFRGIERGVGRLFRAFGTIVGVIIGALSFLGIIALSVFLGTVLVNWNAPLNDFPLREAASTALIMTSLIAGYLAVLIPLLFVLALGYRLMRKQHILSPAIGFGMVGVWALAIITAGVSGATIGAQYANHVKTSPEYATITETKELEAFSRVVVDGTRITLVNGDTHSAQVRGRVREMDHVIFEVVDGTLTISEREQERDCFFCEHISPSVTITVPMLDTLEITRGSVSFDNYTDEALAITHTNSSVYGTLTLDSLSLATQHSQSRLDITARDLVIDAADSNLTLDGAIEAADITLRDSSLYADGLRIIDATLDSNDSYAELDVRGSYEETSDRGSRIILDEPRSEE